MKKGESRKRKKIWGFPLYEMFLMAAAFAVMFCAMLTAAQYLERKQSVKPVAAGEFYFTSDLAGTTAATYRLSRGRDISLWVYNYLDELRITRSDISYMLSVSGGSLKEATDISGSDVSWVATEPDQGVHGYTLTVRQGSGNRISSNGHLLSILPEDGAETVTVRIVSTSPYEETLEASFNIIEHKSRWRIEDSQGNQAACLHICWQESDTASVTLKIPDGLYADTAGLGDQNTGVGTGTRSYELSLSPGLYEIWLLKSDSSRDYGTLEKDIRGGTIGI